MNPLPSLDRVRVTPPVGDRGGQRRHADAEAFRRALQQQAPPAEAAAEAPAPSPLQPNASASRRDAQGAPRHIDVLA